MNIIRKIVSVLSWVCFVIIMAFMLVVSPMIAGYKPVVVLSGSMEPTYPVGSVIYYKSTAFEKINEGDAITFKVGEDTLVTHRVVVKNGLSQTFETKGDANETKDGSPVEYKNVVGKTWNICVPYVGYIINSSYKTIAIVIMGGILLLNIILGDGKKENKKNEKQKSV